jgi:hypothetical protein
MLLPTLCVQGIVIGWCLARVARSSALAVVLLFTAFLIATHIPSFLFFAGNALEHERYVPYFTGFIVRAPLATTAATLGLIGGILIGQASPAGERSR